MPLHCGYGLLSAVTPFVLISLLLLVGGFLRSFQFTALNALTYADIFRANTSNATTFYAVAQQFSLSAGVAVAAFVLEAVQAVRGETIIAADDFSVAFSSCRELPCFPCSCLCGLMRMPGLRLLRGESPPAAAVAEGPVEL